MNKVFLSGNLTRDPEVRYSQSGKAFVKMGIAVNRHYKEKDSVEFFNLTAWEKTAEFCGRYLKKGSRVLVEGRLQTSSYENKDGVKINSVDIMIENIEFGSSKQRSDGVNDDYSGGRSSGNNDYSNSGYSNRREQTPPRKNNYDDFGGEPIDPEDTPF
ncbi:MAG: single-stranded DNA-binding protein [Selenomonadaceae bacterium]|nr:single-stranded DNA-binding protein [Selenomonadaceae bacterium]